MRVARLVGLLTALGPLACTDAGLQPAEGEDARRYDNLLTVKGEFCVQPDNQVTFPVKVLFLLDRSASLQGTDPAQVRISALNELLGKLSSSRSTSVGVLGFSDDILVQPFTSPGAIDTSQLQGLGVATDYQGTLAVTLRLLEQDMLDASPSERARTRYVIVFMSDGAPEPRCTAGCEDARADCSDREDNDGDGDVDRADPDCANIDDGVLHPDSRYGICNTTLDVAEIRRQAAASGAPNLYADYTGVCPAYNQPEQILRRIDDILELRDIYGVGDITFNTVFLFSPDPIDAIANPTFGYDRDTARALMQSMARKGGGVYRDANVATATDNFLDFDFQSLNAPQSLAHLTVQNMYAAVSPTGPVADRDHDGLADRDEETLGTDADRDDSDAPDPDGYTDLFETRLAENGFDALDRAYPAVGCSSWDDLDRDGLHDCEEAYLGTNPRHHDSDHDGISDWLEVVYGLGPLLDDAQTDLDFDGVLNLEEIAGGTHPAIPDGDRYRTERIQYRLDDLGVKTVTRFATGRDEERRCYAFEARDIQLIETPLLGADRGLNRILIYADERPAQLGGTESLRSVACFDVQYLGEHHKIPEDGVIDASGPGWLRVLGQVQKEMDSLSACDWFGSDTISSGAISQVLDDCFPDRIQLGDYLYDRDEIRRLVIRHIGDGAVQLPQPASELFVELAVFNPSRDCYRPWELDQLFELFDLIKAECACRASDDEDPNVCCAP